MSRGARDLLTARKIAKMIQDFLDGMDKNKAVYTTAPDAGGWAGAVISWAGAVISWAGAVISWAGAIMIRAGALTTMKYSYLNLSTFKQLKNAKKAKCDRTDRQTDRQTDRLTDRHGDL